MYFGQSLGHIGADFRGLIAPVFVNVTVKRFSDLLKATEITWQTDLQTFLKSYVKNVRMNQTHDEVRGQFHGTFLVKILTLCFSG